MRIVQGKVLLRCALVIPSVVTSLAASAELFVVPDAESQFGFGGEGRRIPIRLNNAGEQSAIVELRSRLIQAGSGMAARVGEASWKKIQVLAGQTILETVEISLPVVRAESRFIVQWLEGTNRILGRTEVLVYPTNLLQELKPLAGEDGPGVLDPLNRLKPLLKGLAIEFVDLEEAVLEGFHGKLVIAGPFASRANMREGLGKRLEALAAKGTAVVWIQPPSDPRDKLRPSFYTVPAGRGAVVVVQDGLVSHLSEDPRSQLNLLHLARLALRPEPAGLPYGPSPP